MDQFTVLNTTILKLVKFFPSRSLPVKTIVIYSWRRENKLYNKQKKRKRNCRCLYLASLVHMKSLKKCKTELSVYNWNTNQAVQSQNEVCSLVVVRKWDTKDLVMMIGPFRDFHGFMKMIGQSVQLRSCCNDFQNCNEDYWQQKVWMGHKNKLFSPKFSQC